VSEPPQASRARTRVGFLYDHQNDWIYASLCGLAWLAELLDRYEFIETLDADEATNLEIVFILGYTRILPESNLRSNGLNLVVHESNLPTGRGFSPVQWQVLAGSDEIPVCLIEAGWPVDSGDIYGRTTIRLEGHELLPEIRVAQAEATKTVITSFLSAYPSVDPVSQAGVPSFFRRRTRVDDRLDPEQSIAAQFNRFRIADNEAYPLYFDLHGQTYTLTITK